MSHKVEKSAIGNKVDHFIHRKRRRYVSMVTEFMHQNEDCLIIVVDPKTDAIIMGYDDFIVPVRILDANHKKMGLVRKILKCAKNKSYDKYMNTFLHFIDGGVFAVSKGVLARKQKGRKEPEKQIIKVNKATFKSKCLQKMKLIKQKLMPKQKLMQRKKIRKLVELLYSLVMVFTSEHSQKKFTVMIS